MSETKRDDSPVLETRGLGISFGGLKAVQDFNIKLYKGELAGLIGPNGAGKTTVFNLLTGVYVPTEGSVILNGQVLNGKKTHEFVRAGIARTFQNIRLFSELTVLENLMLAHPACNQERLLPAICMGKGMRASRKRVVEDCEAILEAVGLQDLEGQMSTSLPYGKQRLLEIARALATDPKLVLLDEPGAGMNNVEKDELTAVIYHMTHKMNKHVLLIEHDMRFIMNISDRIVVLDYGKNIAEGVPEEIQNNQDVIEAYLGKTKFFEEMDELEHPHGQAPDGSGGR